MAENTNNQEGLGGLEQDFGRAKERATEAGGKLREDWGRDKTELEQAEEKAKEEGRRLGQDLP